MPLSEADTRAKLIYPALHVRGWAGRDHRWQVKQAVPLGL